MNRLLIITADDFGLTPGVCEAILALADTGVVTATSVLAVAPAWERYRDRVGSAGLSVGVHLCAVGEDPPLLSAREVPSLVDAQGRFPASWREFVARAVQRRVDSADLVAEFSAQIESVSQAGVPITHVDSHQHLHLWPQVGEVLCSVAAAAGVTATRLPQSRRAGLTGVGVSILGRRLSARCRRRGLLTPGAMAGLDEAGTLDTANLVALVERLGAEPSTARRNRVVRGAVEIGCHPGAAVDPDRDRYRWGYRWDSEFEALRSGDVAAAIDRCGFTLGGFQQLADWTPHGVD